MYDEGHLSKFADWSPYEVGICKNLQALSLYEVGHLWKLKFNSYAN